MLAQIIQIFVPLTTGLTINHPDQALFEHELVLVLAIPSQIDN
jgi:hypothetical protein